MEKYTEKKVKTVKGFVIAQVENHPSGYKFLVYSKDEWTYGKGYRYPEYECESLEETVNCIG